MSETQRREEVMFTRKDIPELWILLSESSYITNIQGRKILETLLYEWGQKPNLKIISTERKNK